MAGVQRSGIDRCVRALFTENEMTFDEWFQSQQGEPYDSMYVFAKAAWKAARQDAFALAAEHARSHGRTLSVINDNEAMEFAGRVIGDSIFKCSNA